MGDSRSKVISNDQVICITVMVDCHDIKTGIPYTEAEDKTVPAADLLLLGAHFQGYWLDEFYQKVRKRIQKKVDKGECVILSPLYNVAAIGSTSTEHEVTKRTGEYTIYADKIDPRLACIIS